MDESGLTRGAVVAGLVCLLGLTGGRAGAQNGRRVYDEHLRVKLDQQVTAAKEIQVDAGGWFNFALFNYDDASADRTRTLRQYQLRGWASANLFRVHQFYVRGLVGWDDWNSGDNPTGGRGDEDVDPEFERAWYKLDVGQWIRNRTGEKAPVSLSVKVGREFATIGTSLVLSMPLDLIQLDAAVGDWEVMGLLAKTRSRTPNIDASEPVGDRQQRCFWGVEAKYRGFDRHRPFVYWLDQKDRTAAKPEDALQAYEYTSRYLGAGSTGSLILRDLRYQFEIVGEWGSTFSEGETARKDRIRAMAMDVLLEYLFRTPTRPKVSYEYLFGSGDASRRASATATIGGNRAGTRDHAFNAFGFRDTGLAFAPQIANLNIHTIGASFFPLEHIELCKRMEVGTKVFFYHKAVSGPISDTTATEIPNKWVGWEWDVFCNWRVTSDLTWTIRYGGFQPGTAFADRSCRQFLLTAVTFSF